MSSPQWRGGFSVAIGANNKRQQELYEQYLKSEELREHTTSMAFFASRRDTLLEGTKGAEFYQSILDALDEFEAAMSTTDKHRKDLAFSTLRVLIKQGGDEAKRWKEVYGLEEKLGRARERQDKREIQQRMVVPLAEFYMARSQFVEVVRRAIDQILDGDLRNTVLRHIQLEVERLAEHEPAVPQDLGQIG